MFETTKELSTFFSLSPTRQRKLEKVLESETAGKKKKILADIYRTRWVERYVALETFSDMYVMICTCLDQMIEEGFDAWDADTVIRATGFRSVLHSGSFLVSFVTAKKGLQCVKPLTIKLQSKSKDVCNAHAKS